MYGSVECSLTELLQDPLVGLMMRSDGVDRRSIELLFERIAATRARGVVMVRAGSRQTEA